MNGGTGERDSQWIKRSARTQTTTAALAEIVIGGSHNHASRQIHYFSEKLKTPLERPV